MTLSQKVGLLSESLLFKVLNRLEVTKMIALSAKHVLNMVLAYFQGWEIGFEIGTQSQIPGVESHTRREKHCSHSVREKNVVCW